MDPLFESGLQELLAEVPPDLDPLRVGDRLRRHLAPELARRAAELLELRRRARRKLLSPDALFLSRVGLEQATNRWVAEARAEHVARLAPGATVLDATAGIGGDAMALARAGLAVVAAECDPFHARCVRANLRAVGARPWAILADARHPAARTELVLIDPDRRASADPHRGRDRRSRPDSWSPTLERAAALAEAHRGACIKLPPAFDPRDHPLPGLSELPHFWQWVSSGGELREVALWTGSLASGAGADGTDPGARRVLALDERGGRGELRGTPEQVAHLSPAAAARADWIVDPDPALIRSGLLGLFARERELAPLGPAIAFLGSTGAAPPYPAPLGRLYRVRTSCAADPRQVRRMLREQGVGPITVKKRGHPDSAAELAKSFRGPGEERGILIVTRLEHGHRAFLVDDVPSR